MKKTFFLIIIILCLLINFFSCSNKSEKSRKPVSTISLIPNQNDYVLGSSIIIGVDTKLNGGELEKIELYNGNVLLVTERKPSFSFKLDEIENIGPNTLRVITTKKDGSFNIRYKSYTVLSDIKPKEYEFKLINEYPHSIENFTEGLVVHDGFLFESTGQNGASGIYRSILNSGKILQKQELDKKYFGEGMTILNNKIFQLTYKTKVGFVYDLKDMILIDSFKFDSDEGWGFTNDGVNLIMSDGTSRLTWIDSNNYKPIKYIYVSDNNTLQEGLNELEFVNGSIWANVWTKNYIVEIDPSTGRIISRVDLSKLFDKIKTENQVDVLNGIAFYDKNNSFLITGKYWPKIFEIKLVNSK